MRAAIVRPDASIEHVHHEPVLPDTPAPGLVEFDAAAMAGAVLAVARAALADGGPVDGVGIANQRASTVVWDRATGAPLAPGIGWQDLRTVGTCLALQAEGIRLAPNASATKVMAILDDVDPDRARAERGELCFGTVDTWVAWVLSGGAGRCRRAPRHRRQQRRRHRPGPSGHGGLGRAAARAPAHPAAAPAPHRRLLGPGRPGQRPGRRAPHLRYRRRPAGVPRRAGVHAARSGQGHLRDRGHARSVHRKHRAPASASRGHAGTFPIVAFRVAGETTWGTEAVMLSAGSCVEWLRDDLGLIASASESAAVAAQCESTGDVWFVPALLGLGTPVWDFGARGTLVGLTRGSGRPEVVRAVLEGVAHRGADLVEASEEDSGYPIAALRVDGGMSDNPVFVQALADAIGRPVEISPVLEATTLGVGLLAGLAIGNYASTDELAQTFSPRRTVEPTNDDLDRGAARQRWLAARAKAEATIPDLSGLSF